MIEQVFHLVLGRYWVEVWVGWEDEEDFLEIKVEVGFFRRLWFTLPIRWVKFKEASPFGYKTK